MGFFAREVLQTSGMDCGPAALKSVLEGLGIPVQFERLRNACRTGADGTSLDALEDLALGLGLEAFQEMAPFSEAVDILAARAPCIVVLRAAGGAPHFVVLWSVHGPFVQIMDPASGRRFVRRGELQRELYMHDQTFTEEDFAAWWRTTAWSEATMRRLARIGAPLAGTSSGRAIVELDGAARFVERLARRGAAKRSRLSELLDSVRRARSEDGKSIVPRDLTGAVFSGTDDVEVTGAVFLAIRRPKDATSVAPRFRDVLGWSGPTAFDVLRVQLGGRGATLVASLGATAVLVVLVAVLEMLFIRAAFNAHTLLSLPQQRLAGTALYALLVVVLLALEVTLGFGIVRLGRVLELRMRLAMLTKLPRLPDAYFRTRPMSDVTHRSNGLFHVKALPEAVFAVFKASLELIVTALALCIVHPPGIPWALLALVVGLGAPYVSLQLRRRVELHVQAHASSLGQVYLDALLGLVPLRTHGGQLSIRTKQERHLAAWRSASERAVALLSACEVLQTVGILACVTALVLRFLAGGHQEATLLLLAFWALRLPIQARALSTALQRAPEIAASMSRLVEPITAEETPAVEVRDEDTLVLSNRRGTRIELSAVRVVLGTERVLDDVSFVIEAGKHVAVVGTSGAGKSSLVACILGVLERAGGSVKLDGMPQEVFGVQRLRRETVWIDPSVQLWNRSLLENVQFGNPRGARHSLHEVVDVAELKGLLAKLPYGLATELGESGVRVSGGEGQRVRLSRGLLRRGSRLVLLDEAFRGLDRATRRRLSTSVRASVNEATLLEVTHDVSDTIDFDQVLVIEGGRLVEQGSPRALLGDSSSRYAALVAADRAVQSDVWDAKHWKRLVVADGRVETLEGDA